MRRWRSLPEEQRAWVLGRIAAVDPYRMNAWTEALDAAIAVLDRAARPLTVKVKRDRRK